MNRRERRKPKSLRQLMEKIPDSVPFIDRLVGRLIKSELVRENTLQRSLHFLQVMHSVMRPEYVPGQAEPVGWKISRRALERADSTGEVCQMLRKMDEQKPYPRRVLKKEGARTSDRTSPSEGGTAF